jgi:ABC-type Fe3+-hydroxamate transport system substrate-binding protein
VAYSKLVIAAQKLRDDVLEYLISCRAKGLKVAAYGAAAKGNTLLNYAGVKSNLIQMVCDSAPSKQGNYLPGSHIPIVSLETLKKYSPDVVIILPWNLSTEILGVLRTNLGFAPKVVRFSPAFREL